MYYVGRERTATIGLPDKNDHCYVCGRENARGLKVPFGPDGEGGSRAVYTVQGEHIGWPGLLHGGLAFALMDEALGWCLYYNGLRGYTARAETRFRNPAPVGAPLVVTAKVLGRRRRLVDARAELRLESGGLVAEVDATMYLV